LFSSTNSSLSGENVPAAPSTNQNLTPAPIKGATLPGSFAFRNIAPAPAPPGFCSDAIAGRTAEVYLGGRTVLAAEQKSGGANPHLLSEK